jgi:acyl-CoA thioesterase-2
MPTAVKNLLEILDLETLEQNLFRGRSPQDGWQRVFGGQVIGQALVAASRTVDDRIIHSLHGYFMRPGDPQVPIIYEVDRIRDGKSFTTRRVVAIQHGEAIFSMSASFHKAEEGFDHQHEMPDVPAPEDLPSEAELKAKIIGLLPDNIRAYWERERPIELRPVDISRYFTSDFTLLDTALIAHGRVIFDPELMLASLDHAVWFHREFRADDWLLYSQDSPSASGARGYCRGSIFKRDGSLVASVAQEGLIRKRI